MDERTKLLQQAVMRKRESKTLDFKATIDLESTRDWGEVVKDMVAMANSGGGVIVVGVDDRGLLSGADVSALAQLDPAKITDKVSKYTGEQFQGFDVEAAPNTPSPGGAKEAWQSALRWPLSHLRGCAIPAAFRGRRFVPRTSLAPG